MATPCIGDGAIEFRSRPVARRRPNLPPTLVDALTGAMTEIDEDSAYITFLEAKIERIEADVALMREIMRRASRNVFNADADRPHELRTVAESHQFHDPERSLEDAPLVDHQNEEVAAKQRTDAPSDADALPDLRAEHFEAGLADALGGEAFALSKCSCVGPEWHAGKQRDSRFRSR